MSLVTEKSGVVPQRVFGAYRPAPGVYDECSHEPGAFRPHWQPLLARLEKMGAEELGARWENGRRIIREHGVTYNVYGDSQGVDRPWELDPIPLLLPKGEWQAIEAGLIQRARLLNGILADLYGAQRL